MGILKHPIKLGQELVAGQELGKIGKESDSGGWFCHLHLQIITQKAMNEGYSEYIDVSKCILNLCFINVDGNPFE